MRPDRQLDFDFVHRRTSVSCRKRNFALPEQIEFLEWDHDTSSPVRDARCPDDLDICRNRCLRCCGKEAGHQAEGPQGGPEAATKPAPHEVHNAVPTHAHANTHYAMHHFYAGTAPRSLTWYRHHRHRGWVYEVRFRSNAWHERAFATHLAAHTYSHHLGWHHFQRRVFVSPSGAWMVAYRNPHSHHFGTYAALPVARRVEVGLRAMGFAAWLHWHHRYWL